MFWLCRNLGQYWTDETLVLMERRLILLFQQEITEQKKLDEVIIRLSKTTKRKLKLINSTDSYQFIKWDKELS